MSRTGIDAEGRQSFSLVGMIVFGVLYVLIGCLAWAASSTLRPYLPWAWFIVPVLLTIIWLTVAHRAAKRWAREQVRRSNGGLPAWTAYVEPSSASVFYGMTVRGGNVMMPGTITLQDDTLTWQFRKTRESSPLAQPIQWSLTDPVALHKFRSIGRKGMLTLPCSGDTEAYISIENVEDFSQVTGIPLGARA